MKGTQAFRQTICRYLSGRASLDPSFAARFSNPEKKIEDCITYILNQVQKSGASGFTDDEIYSLAVHYYTEDNIEVGSPVSCDVVVNHQVQLTEEEIREMKEKARQEVFSKEAGRLRSSGKVTQSKAQDVEQLLLF